MEKLTRAASLQIVSDKLVPPYCIKESRLSSVLPRIKLYLKRYYIQFRWNGSGNLTHLALFPLTNPSLRRISHWMSVEGGII